MSNGDSLAGFVSGGMDTARVRGDQADVQRRQRDARRARANAAAVAVDEFGGMEKVKRSKKLQQEAADRFAELLEMLGLNVLPEHEPGHCRRSECGRPLPMSAASSASHATLPYFRAGYCSARCWGG